jgi:hypothetical protein
MKMVFFIILLLLTTYLLQWYVLNKNSNKTVA